ncbi:NADH-quinone oxidoreductase subunit J [Vulgatibacter sp.]|uniref:NADH-quinone oxidoreductase subunit J family protein n=1 Tax=Vulgatibacter sp. TaxID=1971226 RepID=UPI003568C27E
MTPLLAAAVAEGVIFYPLAILTLAGAFTMILSRNPVYAAMSLVLTFFGIAAIYVLLSAELLAALQIIVYAGAIMVLFLFVIMLLNITEAEMGKQRITVGAVVGGAVALVFWMLSYTVFEGLPNQEMPTQLAANFGEVVGVGRILFTQFILPFEATGILLLVAIVGAVVVAKAKI